MKAAINEIVTNHEKFLLHIDYGIQKENSKESLNFSATIYS